MYGQITDFFPHKMRTPRGSKQDHWLIEISLIYIRSLDNRQKQCNGFLGLRGKNSTKCKN
jgi:hypothetical protein